MYQKDVPPTDSPSMGSQDLANFILWLIEGNQLPDDLIIRIQEGAVEELVAREKTVQTTKDDEEMWVRWIKQRIRGELESLQMAHDEPEQLEGFMSFQEGQQTEGGYSAEAEEAAKQLQEQLASEENLYYDANEWWDDKHEWQDAYEYDSEEWKAWNRELAALQIQQDDFARNQDDSAAAEVKGKIEVKAARIATAQIAKGAMSSACQGAGQHAAAATGQVEEQDVDLLGTGQNANDDKPLLDPPEIDDEYLIRDTEETPHWIPGVFPSISQNETGDPYKYLHKKPDLMTWGPHVLRSRG